MSEEWFLHFLNGWKKYFDKKIYEVNIQCLRFYWDTAMFLHIIFGGLSATAAELNGLTDWPELPSIYSLALT